MRATQLREARLASAIDHPNDCAIYDALYLALAQRLGSPFITADYKLYRSVRHLPEVIWIAQYPLLRA